MLDMFHCSLAARAPLWISIERTNMNKQHFRLWPHVWPRLTIVTKVLTSCSVFVSGQVFFSPAYDPLHHCIMAQVRPAGRQLLENARFLGHFKALAYLGIKEWRIPLKSNDFCQGFSEDSKDNESYIYIFIADNEMNIKIVPYLACHLSPSSPNESPETGKKANNPSA